MLQNVCETLPNDRCEIVHKLFKKKEKYVTPTGGKFLHCPFQKLIGPLPFQKKGKCPIPKSWSTALFHTAPEKYT